MFWILFFFVMIVMAIIMFSRFDVCKKCGGKVDTYNGITYKCMDCGERQ